MTTIHRPQRTRPAPSAGYLVFSRAVFTGMGTGAGIGAAVGTLLLPLVGTVIGLLYGATVGTALGLANAPVLIAVAASTRRRAAAAMAAALTSGGTAALIYPSAHALTLPIKTAFVLVCAIVGAIAGPRAAYGRSRRAADSRSGTGAHAAAVRALVRFDRRIGRAFVAGATVAGVLGALGGLIFGLVTYPPTAWAAALIVGAASAPAGGLVGAGAGLLTAATTAERVVGTGGLLGAGAGGIAGTHTAPVYGTALGAIGGAWVGAAGAVLVLLLGSIAIGTLRPGRRR